MVDEGDVLAGKYRLEQKLGEGGMGVVFAARHLRLEQRFAIKVLRVEVTSGDRAEVLARFEREARAAARVTSEHVGRVVDVDSLEDGSPYLVMEHLVGEDLADRIARGPLSVEEMATYLLQACEALAEAHVAGIIHRDLKPSNVFLHRAPDGRVIVKVLDFGISKMAKSGETELTRTGAMLGTPHYMAPEQMARTNQADARADIWSLGVIAFKGLSGHQPFGGESLTEVVAAVISQNPCHLSSLTPSVPRELGEVVARCLSKAPELRFPDVCSFAEAIAPFAPAQAAVSLPRIRAVSQSAAIAATVSSRNMPAAAASGPSLVPAVSQSPAASPPSFADYSHTLHGNKKTSGWRVFAKAVGASVAVGVVVIGVGFFAYVRGKSAPQGVVQGAPAATTSATVAVPASAVTTPIAPTPTGVVSAASAPATATPVTHDAGAPAPRPRVTQPSSTKPAHTPPLAMPIK